MQIPKILLATLALAALPATATTTYYCSDANACGANTEAAFNAAFGSLITAGLTSSGTVNFTGETSGTTVFDIGATNVDFAGFNGGSAATLNVVGSQLRHSVGGGGTGIRITLPGLIYAIGLHVTTPNANKLWCFEEFGGNCDIDNMVLTNGTTSFAGVISDVVLPTQQFRQVSGTGTLYINDFTIAEAPEGATFLLVGAGLIALRLLKRRAKAKEPPVEQCRQSSQLTPHSEPGAGLQT